MQQGMLIHSIGEEGAYVQQIVCSVGESLDVPLFRSAWQRVLDRHPVLRSSFHWEGVEEPFQEVHRDLECPFKNEDWRAVTPESQQERLQSYLRADRQRGFESAKAPLLRVALFRLADCDYRIVWTFHHALLDGRSDFLVLKEVFDLYDASCDGQEFELKQLRPFSDYIERLAGLDFTKAEAFWRQRLHGITAPPVLGESAGVLKESQERIEHACVQLQLSEELTSQLRSLSRRSASTLNNLIQASWALLMGRYTREEEVVFGVTRACRHWAGEGAKSMVGLFINTLPLRVSLRPEQPLVSLLEELRAQHITLRDYEHTPLTRIHEWSQVPRDTPLFDTVLVFEDYEINSRFRGLGERWAKRDFKRLEQTNYPLTLSADAGRDLILKLEYDKRRFGQSNVERMLKHLEALLKAMAAEPDRCIGELSMLTEEERHQLVVEWNQTKTDYPKNRCLHELFEAQVQRTPDAVAVVFGEQSLSYRELNFRANQLAHHLRSLGVGPEVIVGLCVERSLELMISLLGILKAGGAYLPLDAAYPQEHLSYVLADAEVQVLVTRTHLREIFANGSTQLVCVDADWNEISLQNGNDPKPGAESNNVAYVIHTSGSTGKPKGTLITQSSLINYLVWFNENIGCKARLLPAVTSLCFDASLEQIFAPLLRGDEVWMLPEGILAEPAKLLNTLATRNDVAISVVPSVWRAMLDEVESSATIKPESLRCLLIGGERLSRELVDRSFAAFPKIQIWNLYGPTETTCSACSARVFPEGLITIGRPIANTQIYILDRHLQLVPVGVPGEMHIGGAGLARGYLNQPHQTAERFIQSPFSENPGDRLYKTGDLARYLPGGDIEYLDRIDDQVKIRGYRVEPGEIEAALSRHPAVRENVVIAREDRPGDKRLVAYLVLNQTPIAAISELRRHLEQTLPAYMVPTAFVELESLPLTPNGKIDRKALPVPDRKPQDQDHFVAPRDEIEAELAHIWARVLGNGRVGVRDSFFELGGNSLLAARMFSETGQVFGKHLPLPTLFQRATIEQLATLLRNNGKDRLRPEWSSLVAIQSEGSKRPFFCVHGVGGNVLLFRTLARYLGPDQPLYGLQSAGLDGERLPHTSVEEMAAHYITEISSVQPEGPYLLGGLSFGGVVAFEMARQLHRQGREVGCVVLLDASAKLYSDSYRLSERMHTHFSLLKRLRTSEWFHYFRSVARTGKRKLKSRIWRVGYKWFRNGNDPLPPALRQIKEINYQAAREYVLQPYSGRVALFRALDHFDDSYWDDDLLGWDKFAAGVDLYRVPGDHVSMVNEPHVQVLAKQLNSCLDSASLTVDAADSVREKAIALALKTIYRGLNSLPGWIGFSISMSLAQGE